ncbi:MAG: shikimate kinase, partial [Thiomonas sp.]
MDGHSIFLIGLMGAGKTTVGRTLAQRLGLRFVDADHEIEREQGCTIAELFARLGEAGFRDIEARAIDALTQREGVILATGGGAVLRPENRKALHERGTVVY